MPWHHIGNALILGCCKLLLIASQVESIDDLPYERFISSDEGHTVAQLSSGASVALSKPGALRYRFVKNRGGSLLKGHAEREAHLRTVDNESQSAQRLTDSERHRITAYMHGEMPDVILKHPTGEPPNPADFGDEDSGLSTDFNPSLTFQVDAMPDPADFELPHQNASQVRVAVLELQHTVERKLPHESAAAVAASRSHIIAIAEGTGALSDERSPTGFRELDREMKLRLQVQDAVVLGLLLTVYLVTLSFGWSLVYRISKAEEDRSNFRFYSGPADHALVCEANDEDGFLNVFNRPPQKARLVLLGFRRTASGIVGVRWRGHRYRQVFNVALDLSPFIQGGEISRNDHQNIEKFLSQRNTLEELQITKECSWAGWEDLGINIRQKIRTLGFEGILDVKLETSEDIVVRQNHAWPNFVHHRTTRVLAALSMVGGIFYLWYTCWRCRRQHVRSKFQVVLSPAHYWELIENGLNAANGFLLE